MLIAVGSLAVSIVALAQARTKARGEIGFEIHRRVEGLLTLLGSDDVMDARRKLEGSGPVIRTTGEAYDGRNWWYPRPSGYSEDAQLGARTGVLFASDLVDFERQYSTVLNCVERAAWAAPPRRSRMRAGAAVREWRRQSGGVYAHLGELLMSTGEGRWELHKIQAVFAISFHDQRVLSLLARLNAVRPRGSRGLVLPHAHLRDAAPVLVTPAMAAHETSEG
ncbi:hypothetical protein [Leifsonia shinshuensis]|uniref:Uncharacterized protein n=1 Tax=Leifsonia shinshuensis TaxID=150026 RepID=A0A853D485_9MICO|nr:hypothetical protein [Leifsonia shinshuensis]